MAGTDKPQWLQLVAILVINYHQPIDVAWRFTLREFFMVADFKREVESVSNQPWDIDKVGDFTQHLRNLGVNV